MVSKGQILSAKKNGGVVTAYGKDGGRAILSVGEDGGSMAIYNKGDKHVLQAGETGGTGLIMTLDKNGYRTGSLP